MDSRYILEKSSVGTRLGGADFNCRAAGRSVLRDARVPTANERGGPGAPAAYSNGHVFYKLVMDGGSAAEVKGERTSTKGNGLYPGGRVALHDVEKVSTFVPPPFHAGNVNCTLSRKADVRSNR